MPRVTVVPIKKEPRISMHSGSTKVHLLVQRQRPPGKDVGAVLDRNGRKSFVGFYHDRQVGELITQAREKVFCSFGDKFVRVDAGNESYILRRHTDAKTFEVHRGGLIVGRGKVAQKTSFIDTHDAKFVAIAPEVLLVLIFHDLES